jgi:hypothetical protein
MKQPFAFLFLVLIVLWAVGCRGATKTNAPQASNPGSTVPQGGFDAYPAADRVETAESAAARVAAMPPLTSIRAQQEVGLQAALYRAAYENNVGDFTRSFLLQSIEDVDPPNLGMDPAEFRLRVLAQLADLHVPIAWLPQSWKSHGVDYFPGTTDRATRLRIRMLKRDENVATVQAEVSDWTADVGASRQTVTATWDGRKWNIERDRVRLVW